MSLYGEPIASFVSPRLLLRLPKAADAEPLRVLMTEKISARLAAWPAHLTAHVIAERIANAATLAGRRQMLALVLERQADGVVMGWVSVMRSGSNPDAATLSYWLGAAFEGQGYMREATCAALSLAFHYLDVVVVRASVQGDNKRSIAVLHVLGASRTGAGRIWCSAREREEDCEWWEIHHPGQSDGTQVATSRLPVPAVTASCANVYVDVIGCR